MKQAFFVTGTDTGVGKTHIACQLIAAYVAQGYKVIGMKPVAAGCELVDGVWVNEDVLKLEAVSNVQAPRELINPYSFKEAIAPHIAAEKEGVEINIEVIQQAFNKLKDIADIVIVEGAGGFLVPLNTMQTSADLALALNIPVILVVNMKLGCINHSLLTAEAIQARNLTLHGWVANQLDLNMYALAENEATLAQRIQAPRLLI
ncbi:MAG TPA: dethiobiotin synthase [Methylotenera sp.]|nr:dethiobiotin synthase [Methylotenera sp.]